MEEIGSRVGRILVEPIERDFGRKSSRSAGSSMRGRRAIGRAKGPARGPAFPFGTASLPRIPAGGL